MYMYIFLNEVASNAILTSRFVCFLFWVELIKQQFVATKCLPLTCFVLNKQNIYIIVTKFVLYKILKIQDDNTRL